MSLSLLTCTYMLEIACSLHLAAGWRKFTSVKYFLVGTCMHSGLSLWPLAKVSHWTKFMKIMYVILLLKLVVNNTTVVAAAAHILMIITPKHCYYAKIEMPSLRK